MAHFYAEIRGLRRSVSRTGSKASGMFGHIRGWNVGCAVQCHYDHVTDSDVIYVYRTGGSHGDKKGEILVATFYEDGNVQFASALNENFGITFHRDDSLRGVKKHD